jgi:putative addiction module component (TIGR02574 family)
MNYPTLDELRELSVEDRLRLLDDLWSTFDDPNSLAVSEEHRRELDRRLQALESTPETGELWSDVQREISAQR